MAISMVGYLFHCTTSIFIVSQISTDKIFLLAAVSVIRCTHLNHKT